MSDDLLRPLWYDSLPGDTDGQAAGALFDWLAAQYTQPWRAYHTLAHIERMFRVWKQAAASIPVIDRQSLALAIWFHDAVYDPQRRDNEAKSAEEAMLRLGPLGIDCETLSRIIIMILATATHQVHSAESDAALLLDLDLEILGAEPVEYDAYALAIHQEYNFVPEPDYRSGRTQVLKRFLERPRIYLTGPMFAQYETAARHNLAREIAALEGKKSAGDQ